MFKSIFLSCDGLWITMLGGIGIKILLFWVIKYNNNERKKAFQKELNLAFKCHFLFSPSLSFQWQ